VSPSGSDANNGLGPDASAATNKPWLTIGKALGASGIASGDTVYLAPGVYREVVTVNMTSATAETKVLGDPANAQGFKNGSGVLLAPGQVQWTAYTTNDKTAPGGTLLNLNARDFLTFQNILLVGGNGVIVLATTTTSTDCKFVDCGFLIGHVGSQRLIDVTAAFNTALNWTFDRCFFIGGASDSLRFTLTTGTGADYDANVLIENSLFVSGGGISISVAASGASANKGGGIRARNCTAIKRSEFMLTAANVSATIACTVNNCAILGMGNSAVALNANTSGQITEDYNLIQAATPRTNVTAGTHSISDGSYAPLFSFGQTRIFGMNLRPFGEPWTSSPLLAFGNDGTQTAYDLRHNPRPAGGASASPAIGALERSNTWAQETGTVRTGSNALSITGPGYQDFDIPVDATSTTVSVYMRYDSTYAGTKPQIQVLNGGECGVTDDTSSAVVTVNSWEQLSLTFTPTRAGIVTIRLLSSDTNGAGKAFSDDFAVA